jgi:2-oxo-3-hexenedioate decarboxylase
MLEAEIGKLAGLLDHATLRAYEVERLTLAHPDLNVSDAYQIQRAGIQLRTARGEKVLGFKMGLTSQAKRQQMNLDTSIFGVLTDRMQVADEGTFSLEGTIHPKIEPEIAFVTCQELKGKPSFAEVLEAIDYACPALEILDSRFKDFKYFSLPDVIADNCSSSYFILGRSRVRITQADLAALEMILKVDGQVVQKALSKEISGNPVYSVLQLCELLNQEGLSLPAGSIVLAGAATQAVTLRAGSQVELTVEQLDSVSVKIV